MIPKRIEELLEKIAKEHNKPYYVIYEIYMSQYKLTREQVGLFDFPVIKLPAWGKYVPSKTKLKKYDKYGTQNNKDSTI